jgi:hypothetical protein
MRRLTVLSHIPSVRFPWFLHHSLALWLVGRDEPVRQGGAAKGQGLVVVLQALDEVGVQPVLEDLVSGLDVEGAAHPAVCRECPGANVIKLFHGRMLRIFVISWSVCPWQAFPALSNIY